MRKVIYEKNDKLGLGKVEENLPEIMRNPVIQEFLEDENNKSLFYQAFENPKEDNIRQLDIQFKRFYRYNRIIRYLSGLIRRYPIDYDKRVKLRKNRYPLTVDKTVTHNNTGSTMTMVDLIQDKSQKSSDYYLFKQSGSIFLENEQLLKLIEELNRKQRQILYLYYEIGFNNKEIGSLFGQTEQNISYWHKKTLKYLKDRLDKIN